MDQGQPKGGELVPEERHVEQRSIERDEDVVAPQMVFEVVKVVPGNKGLEAHPVIEPDDRQIVVVRRQTRGFDVEKDRPLAEG